MYKQYLNNGKIRKIFNKNQKLIAIPHLLLLQTQTYKNFLQMSTLPKLRNLVGLESIFYSIFPINSVSGYKELNYINYRLSFPFFSEKFCKAKGYTFSVSLKVVLRLILYDKSFFYENKKLIRFSDQEVYLGDIPFMTVNGSFIINGIERVLVSQLHRSPGLFYFNAKIKNNQYDKNIYYLRIIPYRGSWLDFEFDIKNLLYFRIDRKKKIYISVLLQALGFTKPDIMFFFCETFLIISTYSLFFLVICFSLMRNKIFEFNFMDDQGNIILTAGSILTNEKIFFFKKKKISKILIPKEWLIGKTLSKPVIYKDTLLFNSNVIIDNKLILNFFYYTFNIIIFIVDFIINNIILKVIKNDICININSALSEIYKIIRPGDPITKDFSTNIFKFLFFSVDKYDFSLAGRMKFNYRLDRKYTQGLQVVSYKDLIDSIIVLLNIYYERDCVDDIDHLGNRRIKTSGEIMKYFFRVGLLKTEKIVKERLSMHSNNILSKPQTLINPKPITSTIKDFFCTGSLSQFMDQDNPLSEITHKRKISTLGPGGLLRERAGFEIRDVHHTHYSKICPIETPEGPNIGLINSLACFSLLNFYGFLEAPYQQIYFGYLTNNIFYLSALDEDKFLISQLSDFFNYRNFIKKNILIQCRSGNDVIFVDYFKINFIDISSFQLVSVAASLIPFLEHNDANRALMGSNMQRQAVPLLILENPLVATGMEKIVAYDSRLCLLNKRKGVVYFVDSTKIIIKTIQYTNVSDDLFDIYKLDKFKRSNKNTCMNYVPNVTVGEIVMPGDSLINGFGIQKGELSLGKNLLVAFMPFYGLNFEDSIVLSDSVLDKNQYTSIYLEELICYVRHTKLGPEEITFDIFDTNNYLFKQLDIFGIVYIGAQVYAGDILVSKVTPITDKQVIPEEKLLKAIFGEKSSNMKNTSLRVPDGLAGIVVDVNIISKNFKKIGQEYNLNSFENYEFNFIRMGLHYKNISLKGSIFCKIYNLIYIYLQIPLIDQFNLLTEIKINKFFEIILQKKHNKYIFNRLCYLKYKLKQTYRKYKRLLWRSINKNISEEFELASDIIKIIKIFIAVTRKIQPGDKMSGRHGNKGVVSTIIPTKDMPYLLDGTPIDIILNPLGVPSRMNVGQLFETYIGYIIKNIGFLIKKLLLKKQVFQNIFILLNRLYDFDFSKIYASYSFFSFSRILLDLVEGLFVSSPIFQGIDEKDISLFLKFFNFIFGSQQFLYNGMTGVLIERKVTVGYIYMFKLDHLVDDKMHARSTGSYSLITQQPLGGKAQFGGQRFGEMEVWALQAYGAAYILREMLTVKSDDILGRVKMYKNIIDGIFDIDINIPESFNVLLKEIQALGIDIRLQST